MRAIALAFLVARLILLHGFAGLPILSRPQARMLRARGLRDARTRL